MRVMNAQPPLPVAPAAGAVSIGEAVALVEDSDGGRVFLRGELVYAWSAHDVPLRRLAAVQLVVNKAARVGDVAAARRQLELVFYALRDGHVRALEHLPRVA